MPRAGHLLLIMAVLLAAACSGSADQSPKGVVEQALRAVENKDTAALTALACASSADRIQDRLDLTRGLGAFLPADMDTTALLDAIEIDASKVTVTEKSVTGDTAIVSLGGTVGMTVDKDALKDVMRDLAASQGIEMDEAQLNGLMLIIGSYTDAIPMEMDLDLVRENDAWRICG